MNSLDTRWYYRPKPGAPAPVAESTKVNLYAWDPRFALPTRSECAAIVNAMIALRKRPALTREEMFEALSRVTTSARRDLALVNAVGVRPRITRAHRHLSRRALNSVASLLEEASMRPDTAHAAVLLTYSCGPEVLEVLHLTPRPFPTWYGQIRAIVSLTNPER